MRNLPVMTANMRILPVRSSNVRISQVMAGNLQNSPVMKDDRCMSHIGHCNDLLVDTMR